MARRHRRNASRIESKINVTPMGDVSLSLLLGFLVITPIILETVSATLPQGGGVASGQVKQETTIASCQHLGLRQLGDQEINIVDIVRPVTKYAAMVRDPKRIRWHLEEHPEEREEIFNYNPSYVFFTKGSKGPLGAIGTPLVAMQSIATDLSLFPKGALAYIETEIPVFDSTDKIIHWKPYRALVLNQDTGGAIKGYHRVDLYTGNDQEAEQVAGSLKQIGNIYILWPKKLSIVLHLEYHKGSACHYRKKFEAT